MDQDHTITCDWQDCSALAVNHVRFAVRFLGQETDGDREKGTAGLYLCPRHRDKTIETYLHVRIGDLPGKAAVGSRRPPTAGLVVKTALRR